MHEVFGHSLKVKYFTYRSISSIWILATIVNMKIISEKNVEKRQTMQCKFEKSQKQVQQI